jgi:hypothetical protein
VEFFKWATAWFHLRLPSPCDSGQVERQLNPSLALGNITDTNQECSALLR